jgi:hypothetical protein
MLRIAFLALLLPGCNARHAGANVGDAGSSRESSSPGTDARAFSSIAHPRTDGGAPFTVEDEVRLAYRSGDTSSTVIDLAHQRPSERFRGPDAWSFDFMSIAAQGDFDLDGVPDAVVALYINGNAFPGPWYATVSGGHVSPTFAGPVDRPLKVVHLSGHSEFVVGENNSLRTFAFLAGRTTLKKSTEVAEIAATQELRYADVERRDGSDGAGALHVDLDGDGRADTISCLALRFLQCTFTNADGRSMGGLISPERLGVLSSVTKGHKDLVTGRDAVVRWNGRSYE